MPVRSAAFSSASAPFSTATFLSMAMQRVSRVDVLCSSCVSACGGTETTISRDRRLKRYMDHAQQFCPKRCTGLATNLIRRLPLRRGRRGVGRGGGGGRGGGSFRGFLPHRDGERGRKEGRHGADCADPWTGNYSRAFRRCPSFESSSEDFSREITPTEFPSLENISPKSTAPDSQNLKSKHWQLRAEDQPVDLR